MREFSRLADHRRVDWYRLCLNDVSDATPSHYYYNVHNVLPRVEGGEKAAPPFDEKGIAIRDYHHTGRTEIPAGRYYNPTIIAQYGLSAYEHFLETGQQKYRKAFLNQARWLRDNHVEGRWECDFPVPSFKLERGWISAMYQGQAISLLMRAYVETSDTRFLESATAALRPFYQEVSDGGVTIHADDGDTWLEEAPAQPPSHILNGHIFAIFGLYDYCRVTGDERVRSLCDQAIRTVARNLSNYERCGWVTYDLLYRRPAPSHYYAIHIAQLRALHAMSQNPVFAKYADKWEQVYEYFGIPFVVRRLWIKTLGAAVSDDE